MSQIARDAGLGGESLYKSLSSSGNPELATVLKVISALGLQLHLSVADNAKMNDPSNTPTGLATSAGVRSGNPPTTLSNSYNAYSIQGSPVPGPLPIFGVYAPFGVSRKLRTRLRATPADRP